MAYTGGIFGPGRVRRDMMDRAFAPAQQGAAPAQQDAPIFPGAREQMAARAFAPDTRPQRDKRLGGIFGRGGVGRAIAGNVGDFLLQYSGMQPIYQPAQQQQRLLAARQQLDEANRQSDWQQWLQKAQWERANPKPEGPTALEQNFRLFQQMSPEERREFDQFQPVIATTWQGPTIVPRSSLAGGARPAIGTVVDNPFGDDEPPQAAPPQAGDNFMTAAQYRAIANEKGEQWARDWAAKYNIRIGG